MRLKIKEHNGKEHVFDSGIISVCGAKTIGNYELEFDQYSRSLPLNLREKESGEYVSYSKNMDVLFRKVIVADKLLHNLNMAALEDDTQSCLAYRKLRMFIEDGDVGAIKDDVEFGKICSHAVIDGGEEIRLAERVAKVMEEIFSESTTSKQQ